MDIKIFQAFHKPFNYSENISWIAPIGVGGYNQNNFFLDSIGQNIAHLNQYYCELTALYWAYKNTSTQYIGLCHYRRYFIFNHQVIWNGSGNCQFKLDDHTDQELLKLIHSLTDNCQLKHLQFFLNKYDVVLPRPEIFNCSIEQQYLQCVESEPWFLFLEILKKTFTDELIINEYFRNRNSASMYNMFVMPRVLFEQYCEYLFSIIDQIFNEIGPKFDIYNNRYPGFLAERFLGFWIYIKGLKIKEVPIIFFS